MGLGQKKSHYRNYCRDSGCGCIGVIASTGAGGFFGGCFQQNPAYLSLAHLLVDG
ncbi:hypothetical protein DDB_G0267200 [Dictyostelium discoideum AX4]|uniref:Uncharacterized protein n=1 Tax=Dictyostelium discoideum TaxID=44689 RepID=Q55H47_DICDI|nr:hypothetical protein DDB_G0267200 [Dictyostelium discoideum AX4]EAL73837.1 hypothetical protein DDB_G0267200 [Dictyostelium discoideum AX4]|eukprot:XP_647761.1 hypothetical protein DDB_G0267200 [Dictyostelium discoideum AX4]